MRKILIATPTSSHKDYCFDQWADKIIKIAKTYDKSGIYVGILIVDNSKDETHANKLYTKLTFEAAKQNYNCFISVKSHYTEGMQLRELMCGCNNIIRDYILKSNVDYLFSLESDIFPNDNVILQLLSRNITKKQIIAHPYFLYHSYYSKSIHFIKEDFSNLRMCIPVDIDYMFSITDSKLHETEQLGLGCALIHRSILKQVSFRIDSTDTKGSHADTFFYEDCRKIGVKLLFDTRNYCIHLNGNWRKIYNLKNLF